MRGFEGNVIALSLIEEKRSYEQSTAHLSGMWGI